MKNNKKNITSLRSFKIKSLSKSINNHFGTYQKGIPSNSSPSSPCASRENFNEQDFSEQDFSQQPNKFYCADLEAAIFGDATLTGANLSYANLKEAILSDATLTNANLTGAILTDADLEDADLTNATLTGATLTNVTGVFDFAKINLIGSLTVQYATTNLKNLTAFNVTNISKIKLQGESGDGDGDGGDDGALKTLIHAIYINGTKYGGNGGSDTNEISLAEGEYINEVTVGNYITDADPDGKSANVIGYLEFKTSKSQSISAGNPDLTNGNITLKNIKVTEIGGAYKVNDVNDYGVYNIKITFTKI